MEKLKERVGGLLHHGDDQHKGLDDKDQHQNAREQQVVAGNNPADQRLRTKRGLCWPVENKLDDPTRFTRPGSQISWLYNWSPHPTKNHPNLPFIPMQWNAGGIKDLHANVERAGVRTVLAFNEPELHDQANMSAEHAAEQWMLHFEPLRKKGVRCGSPGISSAGHAVQWMRDFLGRIRGRGSDVDFWCLHWYGGDLGGFYDYIWSTYVFLFLFLFDAGVIHMLMDRV